MTYVFNRGVAAAVKAWTTATYKWLLVKGTWTPDPYNHVYLGDGPATYELTDGSYSRETMTGPSVSYTLPPTTGVNGGTIVYDATDPDFGILSGAEVAEWLVLAHWVTNDADSEIVAALPCYYTADGATGALFTLAATGALSVRMV